jgi:hypothetical protein
MGGSSKGFHLYDITNRITDERFEAYIKEKEEGGIKKCF